MNALPLPPGPRGHWLFGELKDRAQAPLRLYERLRDDHGDIVRFRVAWRRVVALTSPEAIKHVLVDNNANYSKGALAREADGLLGKGLLTSDGELWKRQRRLMQPAFHKERIAALSAQVVECLEALTARWEQRLQAEAAPTIDVAHEMTQLTLQVVGKTLFGKDVTGESDQMGRAMAAAVEEENRRILDPLHLPMFLPTPNNRRRRRALSAIDRVVFELIDARREGRTRGEDLLQLLVEARDADTGEGMDAKQLRDEVLTLLLAGHETTANALSWTWHLLAGHPEVEAKLLTELSTVLAGRTPGFSDLPRLRYTAQVLEESMRLYPPAWLFIREAIHDDVIGGYRIPAGHIAAICTWALHRHPKLWEKPLRFDPDRFSPERAARRPRYAYVPFGGGQRICIGQSFAMMEATLALATLAQRFTLRAVEGHPVEPLPQVTLRPKHGVAMWLGRRASQAIPPGPKDRPGQAPEVR